MSETMIILLLVIGVNSYVLGDFIASRVYDQKVIIEPFPENADNIAWGAGFNTLHLQPTYNTAVSYGGFRERWVNQVNIGAKLCKTGGEALSFLAGEFSTASAFVSSTTQTLQRFFDASQMTELDTLLVVKIDVYTTMKELTKASLNQHGRELLKNEDYRQFINFYGTHLLSRAYYGGYLYIAIEFMSKSKVLKQNLEKKLERFDGVYEDIRTLTADLKSLDESTATEINIMTVGAKESPPNPNLKGVIEFASKFVISFDHKTTKRVHHVEYHTMFYMLDATFGFRRYARTIQEQVDNVLEISAKFQDLRCYINSIFELHKNDYSYSFLTEAALDLIQQKKVIIENHHNTLQSKFMHVERDDLGKIVKDYKEILLKEKEVISKLLKNEKYFDTTMKFYLRSKGIHKYVSIDAGGYPRLTDTSPIRLMFTHYPKIEDYRAQFYDQYFLITSDTQPHYFLCMGKNNWYVFWELKLIAHIDKCLWNFKPTTRSRGKPHISFSDAMLIYNKYWPDFVIGTTDDGQWLLTARKENAVKKERHHWIVEKTPF